MEIFANNDTAYHQWCESNPNGFVLNYRKYLDKYGVLHRVGCPSLKPSTAHNHPQPFTGNTYRKAVSNDFNDLDEVYVQRLKLQGVKEQRRARPCKKCNPTKLNLMS